MIKALLFIVLGLTGAVASNHGPATSLLGSLVLVVVGIFILASHLFSGLDDGPQTASGMPLSTGHGMLGLETELKAEPGAPAEPFQPQTPEMQQHRVETPAQAAIQAALRDSLVEAPVIVDEPYACLEMLLRELPDGTEVRAIVAAVRMGAAKALRNGHGVTTSGSDKIIAELCESEAVPSDLAQWAVSTWADAFRVRHSRAAPERDEPESF